MKIAIASEHAGYVEKEQLKPVLDGLGIQYDDLGTISLAEQVHMPHGSADDSGSCTAEGCKTYYAAGPEH